MGQAALDLPDPIDKQAAPLASADDLLAQLAGEEIDRLLAEADVEPGPDEATGRAMPSQAMGDPQPIDEESGSLGPTGAEDALSAQLDSLFNELNPPPPAQPAAPSPPQAAQPQSQAELAVPVPSASAQSSSPTQQATPAHIQSSPPEMATAISETDAQDQEAAAPVLVRLLELLNAPFAACPDVLRDILGRIALLTLMNALGVLLYLLLFRRH